MRRRLRIVALVMLGIVVVGTVGLLLFLRFGDLGVFRGNVENLLTDLTGREFRIAGAFEPRVGFTTHLVAEDVTLANPPWASEPYMARVDRLEAEVRLLPLLSGRVEIPSLSVDGARVVVEQHDEFGSNWVFDTGEEPDPDATPVELPEFVVGAVSVSNVAYVLRRPDRTETIRFELRNLLARSDDAGMLDLDLTAVLNDHPVRLAGAAGTLNDLIRVGPARFDITGMIDDIDVDVDVAVSDLGKLTDAVGTLSVAGPELSRIGELAGLPPEVEGAFRIDATFEPVSGGTTFSLDADLGRAVVGASGVLDSLTAPGRLDARVEASGPDLRAVAAPFGGGELPARPFTVTGGVQWAGFPMTFDGVEVVVGDHRAAVDGVLGAPPGLEESDFRVHAEGPALGEFHSIAGVELPPGPYRLDAELYRRSDVIEVRALDARVGRIGVRVEGALGDAPSFDGTDLDVSLNVPDLSTISGLVGYDFPPYPLRLNGVFRERDGVIAVKAVTAALGTNELRAEGVFGLLQGFDGTSLTVNIAGPDLSSISAFEDVPDLPSEPYDVSGRIGIRGGNYVVEPIDVVLGEITAHVRGTVGPLPDVAGSDLEIRIAGPDLARIGEIAGYDPLPAQPFEVEGEVAAVEGGYALRDLRVQVGEISATVSGDVGPVPDLTGTHVRIDAGGPSVSAVGAFIPDGPALPDAAFSVHGTVLVEPNAYRLDPMTVTLGSNAVTASGRVSPEGEWVGSAVRIDIEGDDLDALGAMIAETGLVEVPPLPARVFSVRGDVSVDDAGYTFRSLVAALGDARVQIDGNLASAHEHFGSDLTVTAGGSDVSWLAALGGIDLPVEPFAVHGRVQRGHDGGRFHDVRIAMGDHRVLVDGFLGEPPKLVGTNLDIRASGPSLAFVGALAGRDDLADVPYEVAGHFDGSPTEFSMPHLSVKAGGADLAGSARVDLRDRPTVKAQFTSRVLDLVSIRRQKTEEEIEAARAKASEEVEAAMERETEVESESTSELVIPDDRIVPDFLDDADVDIKLQAGTVVLRAFTLSDFELGVLTKDGMLQVFPLEATGVHGGSLKAGLTAEPVEDGYRLDARMKIDNARLNLTKEEDEPENWPTFDLDFLLRGTGDSMHTILSGANGRAVVVLGPGLLDKSVMDLIVADFLMGFLDVINPFAKEKSRAELECGVIVTNIEDGRARFDPIAVRTDAMTMTGQGRIRFSDEDLNLEWVIKPRKGVGLSASTITNPYIKLGGTLASPALQVKPIQAAASTGAAVATVGISVLARGLWDRVSSEIDVCSEAIAKAERQVAGDEPDTDGKKRKKKKKQK